MSIIITNKKRNRSDKIENENNIKKKSNENHSNFLNKLYDILNTSEYSNIICWGDNGKYFLIKNISEFTSKILPKYFKHQNYSSFVRQVNII